MLAETVSFTEEEILVIMLILLGMLAAAVATVALGCYWAWRAGRGSQPALVGWVIVVAVEALALVSSLLATVEGGGGAILSVPAGALAIQVALYLVARQKDGARR